MGENRLLITYPELRAVALEHVLDVVPVGSGFEVRCAGINRISITLDGENRWLMKVIVNGGQVQNFLKMHNETHNCISQIVTVVRKVNVLLDIFLWCSIQCIWTPCGFRYEIHDARSKYVFCTKQDPENFQNFIVLDNRNEKKYKINVQENNNMQITPVRRANNNLNIEQILTEKLLLVCASVLINKRDNKQRICYCNVNCSLRKQTIIICIVLCLLFVVCIVSFSSWSWK